MDTAVVACFVTEEDLGEEEEEYGDSILRELFWGFGEDAPFETINLVDHGELFFSDVLAVMDDEEAEDCDASVDGLSADVGGSPPMPETAVKNLAVVEISKDEELICAVCREELAEGESVNRLPCLHYYHSSCIVPWLKKRNTCPLCRFELPTDGLEYECSRKRRRNAY